MASLKYWIWLASVSGVSAEAAGRLLRRFETPEKVFLADFEEYRDVEGLRPGDIEQLRYKNIDSANRILGECEEKYIRIITIQDAEYPDRLKNIYDPPIVLYVRGRRFPVVDEEAAVAIVGTRECSPFGMMAAEKIGYGLARHGILVVSGLARGIDAGGARGALRAGGQVLGVLGCGVDVAYPYENRELIEDTAHHGALVSEYPPGTKPHGANFPVRNRILSGLSLGVVVMEAPFRSGALITAAKALEQGRDVFAVPGDIITRSWQGSNSLLREGAIPLLDAENVASEYVALFPDKIKMDVELVPLDKKSADRLVKKHADGGTNRKDDSDNEKKVIDNVSSVEYIDLDKITKDLDGDEKDVAEAIGAMVMHVDEIITKTELSAQRVLTALTMLELKGCAIRGEGQFFSLREPNPE